MGSGHILGVDGDIDLPLSLDADLESLLLGGTLCSFTKRGCGSFSRSLSGSLSIPTTNGPWLRYRPCSGSWILSCCKISRALF